LGKFDQHKKGTFYLKRFINMPDEEGSTISEQWSRDRLMGKSVSFKGIPPEDLSDGANGDKQKRRRSSVKAAEKDIKIDPMLWGQPGHLTDTEADTYVSLPMFNMLWVVCSQAANEKVSRHLRIPGLLKMSWETLWTHVNYNSYVLGFLALFSSQCILIL
jgi:hypothetical protein